MDRLETEKEPMTVRKADKVKDDYEILYKRTEMLLNEFKEREEQW